MSSNTVKKEGHLVKRPSSGGYGSSRQRLFRLTSRSLSYYSEKPGKAPVFIKEIPLFAIENVKSLPYEKLQKKYGFSITFMKQKQTKELVMFAASDKEVEQWIEAIREVKGTSSPRSTGSLQREGMLTTAALLSGDELDIFGDDDEGDSGIFRVKEDKETDIADHRDVIEGNGQDETATDPEQRSSSPSDSSVSLGVSLTSQGSYLSSSSGVISPDSNRDSGSFEPCDIPEQMEPSESKEFSGDSGIGGLSLLELGKKPLAPVLSDVAEEMGSDEDKTPHSPNTEAERKDSVGGLQHSESPVISQNPETGDALETQKTPTSPEENVFEINSPVFSGRKKRKSLTTSTSGSYIELNPLDKLTDGFTPIHIACQQGNVERVKELLKGGANPSVLDTIKQQPCLFHAYIHDHKEVLEVLLDHDCDPGIQEQGHGLQLLHMCAQNGDIATAETLLRHGADIDAKDYREVTPLLMSCESDKLPMIKFLLEKGADVNWLGKGKAALHMASARGDETLVGLLLEYGASVLITDRPDHRKPFDIAVGNRHEKVAEMLRAAQPEEARAYSCLHTLKGHKEVVLAVACSQVDLIASGDVNGTVILWNPVNGSQLHSMDMDNAVVSASFWRSCLVVSTAMVTVLDLERVGWKLELNAAEDGPLQLVAVSPDGHLAVADIDSNQIELWSTGPVEGFVRTPIRSIVADSVLRDKDGVCHSLVFSPDMSIPVLAVSIQPGSRLKSEGNILIHLYSWLTSQLIRVIDMGLPSDASEVCMVFSPHGRYLVAGCSGGLVFMWELSGSGRLLHRLATSDGSAVLSVAVSIDGAQLAAACQSGAIQVFSVQNGDSLFVLSEHQKAVKALAYSPNGQMLVSASGDKTVRVWKVSDRDVSVPASDCEVQPSYPPSRAVTETGQLSDFSRRFWKLEFNRFDEDNDGLLKHSEFNKFYVDYLDQHILPDDFNSLLLNHGLSKDSAITLEVLYNVVGEQFVKDTEGMWKKWVEHGVELDNL